MAQRDKPKEKEVAVVFDMNQEESFFSFSCYLNNPDEVKGFTPKDIMLIMADEILKFEKDHRNTIKEAKVRFALAMLEDDEMDSVIRH